ncbi:MAG TPA: hypothetical protein VLH84_04490 [Patescibacteria group bacterium]|nr:hypothetical protein [Patescibacteria group bacterium]
MLELDTHPRQLAIDDIVPDLWAQWVLTNPNVGPFEYIDAVSALSEPAAAALYEVFCARADDDDSMYTNALFGLWELSEQFGASPGHTEAVTAICLLSCLASMPLWT